MNFTNKKISYRLFYLTSLVILLMPVFVYAAFDMAPGRIADIMNTKHNFAANVEPDLPIGSLRKYRATDQNELCVFCHTPHGRHKDDVSFVAPQPFLWNRGLHETANGERIDYAVYQSDALDANPGQPGASSKMCLSCHDGTVAIGQVNKFRLDGRLGSGEIAFANGLNKIADANGAHSTSLGVDLSNDHPIGFTYDSALANTDTELVDPGSVDYIGSRSSRIKTRIAVPLEKTSVSGGVGAAPTLEDRIECTTCHDPHIRSTDNSVNIKFLRLNRFQKTDPTGSSVFNIDTDINCLACHQKAGWRHSVHAVQAVASESYAADAAGERDFPLGTEVWEAACLNCHDTHTAAGARWLLSNGVTSDGAASEETCYKCHSSNGAVTLVNAVDVADIAAEFGKMAAMPISEAIEVHTVNDSDLTEDAAALGKNDVNKRHVECSDCHHPHRMMRAEVFNATTMGSAGTHVHEAGQIHSNVSSGVLRGVTGIEPDYGADETFDNTRLVADVGLKKGEPEAGGGTDVEQPYVTREYQICFKCHSDFSLGSLPVTLADGRIVNTNIAMEFQPVNDEVGSGINNHRSWHPVVGATGRIESNGADAGTYVAPFNQALGQQTMYCSDCHTNSSGTPKGPHGSIHDNILKGSWSEETGSTTAQDLCFSCHQYDQYANPQTNVANVLPSGFRCSLCTGVTAGNNLTIASKNLHISHAAVGDGSQSQCGLCHVKIPHGWKNKALLVDVSQKVPGETAYYFNSAALDIQTMKPSGDWEKIDCTGALCHN